MTNPTLAQYQTSDTFSECQILIIHVYFVKAVGMNGKVPARKLLRHLRENSYGFHSLPARLMWLIPSTSFITRTIEFNVPFRCIFCNYHWRPVNLIVFDTPVSSCVHLLPLAKADNYSKETSRIQARHKFVLLKTFLIFK